MGDQLTARLQKRILDTSRHLTGAGRGPDEGRRGPWSVEAFLNTDLLRVGDVVLYARDGNLLSAFVKWSTGSQFSHAGMIYYTPRHDLGFEHHFLIEADQNGVDLSPLKPYVQDPAVTIAILRVPDNKVWHTDAMREQMRGRMMETISDTYDFDTIKRKAMNFIKASLFGFRSMILGSSATMAAIRSRKPGSLPHAFICSGLVQLGYSYACLEAIREGRVRAEALRDTVFRNDLLEWFEPRWSNYTAQGKVEQANELFQTFIKDLEATTPADIANSENLRWHYLIRRGRVWQVDTQAEAERLMRQRLVA